jgi:hypothetical protein
MVAFVGPDLEPHGHLSEDFPDIIFMQTTAVLAARLQDGIKATARRPLNNDADFAILHECLCLV